MTPELISVVTVSYNEGDSLLKTMESVVAQSYRPLEYIVIDGGSTDGSYDRAMAVMSQRAADAGIILKAVSERDNGIYDGMNKGASMSSGKWINFMNAGDCFYDNDTISRFFSHEIEPDAALLYGDFIREKDYMLIPSFAASPETIANKMPTSHQAMFILASLMKKYPYDTSYRVVADFDFVYRLYKRGELISYIPVVVAVCEAVQGLSSRHRVLMHKECDRVRGIPLTFRLRVRYGMKSLETGFIRGLNSLIPKKMLLSIKRLNRARLEKRNKRK